MESERRPVSSPHDKLLTVAIDTGFDQLYDSIATDEVSDVMIKAAIKHARLFVGRLERELKIRGAERKAGVQQ